jgi:hypothetical protein
MEIDSALDVRVRLRNTGGRPFNSMGVEVAKKVDQITEPFYDQVWELSAIILVANRIYEENRRTS